MMQLFRLKKVLLTSSLLAASTAGFVDWGDDVPSVEALEQAQRELEQSQREQFSGETCTLSNGNIINAPEFVCANLDRTKAREKDSQEIPPEIAHYSCPPLPAVENGNVFCWDDYRAGTVCIGVCENGWTIENPNKKKKCIKKKTWQKTKPGKSPVKWNLGNQNFQCIRDYLESPCLTENGGCSHDCIDRGDGIGQCVCPCGYELDSNGKICVQTLVCPFDVTFWLDGSSNACNNNDYRTKQKTHMSDLVDFFRREVRTFDARLAAGVYSDGTLSEELSGFESNDVDQIIDDINNISEPSGAPTIADVFDHFSNERADDAATIAFVSMGGELTDSDLEILANRPQNIDNLIVIAQNTTSTQQYLDQTSLMGCGHSNSSACSSVIMIDDGIDAAAIESRVSRTSCYDRTYSSSISCSEFHMEVEIPKCALRGLTMDDITFNSGLDGDCGVDKIVNGSHFHWKINYNDCATVRTVDDEGVISYTNSLKTLINDNAAVFPILPMFDVPLRCDLHTQYEFVFHGDYYPKLTSFQADVEVEGIMTGNLTVFSNPEFTTSFGNGTIETGIPIYVQSQVETMGVSVQLISCITSADDLSDMTAVNNGTVWPLIEDGCLSDWTVSILPRGPDGEVRFTFESFRFQGSQDGEPVNIQCQYKSCLTETCDSVQTCASSSSTRKRKRRSITPMAKTLTLSLS